jgi:hypothetical protein
MDRLVAIGIGLVAVAVFLVYFSEYRCYGDQLQAHVCVVQFRTFAFPRY